jgi:arsenate reductase (thioredoxin)
VAKQRVLFLCIGNSCRSQIAEGLLRHLGGDRFEAHSAGILASHLRPETVEVMKEAGIDISKQWSKGAELYAGQEFDVVVTTCDEAKEVCPLFPGAKRMVHWSIKDPVGQGMDAYRAARDQLKGLIEKELLARP